MSDVKWIKITTDIFDDEKILMIETMPERDTILVIWFKLLCLAGKQNNCGVFIMGKIPYTDEMFAAIFHRPINTVRLALETFQRFGMIEIVSDTVAIPNWNKHQSLDSYEKKKERDRIYQAERRAAQKALVEKSSDKSSDVAISEGDKDLRIKNLDKEVRVNYQLIADMYNEICISFPRLTALSDSRKKAIKARMNTYTEDDFRTLFQKAEHSDFLKGKNKQDWRANFDWLLKDSNMAKVLDGNYDNKEVPQPKAKGDWMGQNDKYFDDARKYIQQRDQYRKAAIGK